MSADWFAGEARGAAQRTFLTRLREVAARDGLRDVPSSTTSALLVGDILLVLVPLPRLTARSRPALQVGLDCRDPGSPGLIGAWEESEEHLLDGAEEIDSAGVPAEPAALAGHAHAWLLEQLDRPVEVRTWRRRWRRPRSEWRLADTDELIARDGGVLTPRRPADVVERLR